MATIKYEVPTLAQEKNVGHVTVLTGVDGGTVLLNDPDLGVKKQGTVDWFNKKLMNSLQGCIMYKDPTAY